MNSKLIVFPLIAVFGNAVHAGEIFRCVAANGDVMFTNIACPAKSQVEHVASYVPVPDSPAATYSPPVVSAAPVPDAAQAQAAYQAGYQQAQAEAQREQSSAGADYAPAWIPFYPSNMHGSHSHDGHHHHPIVITHGQTMTARTPQAPGVVLTPRH